MRTTAKFELRVVQMRANLVELEKCSRKEPLVAVWVTGALVQAPPVPVYRYTGISQAKGIILKVQSHCSLWTSALGRGNT